MQVAIRTDASQVIGTGHVMRCLTLANALRERGAEVSFICREHEGHLCDLVEGRGFKVDRLPISSTATAIDPPPAHASWLGASWQEDLEQTVAVLESGARSPDWLVVDHYAIDRRWESGIRSRVGRLMVIDDLADREHDCDVLLDQNLVSDWQYRYDLKIPSESRKLLGPRYALLQDAYAKLRPDSMVRSGRIRRVLVFMGGADPCNLTERVVRAVVGLKFRQVRFDIVIPSASGNHDALKHLAKDCTNINFYGNLPSLANLMLEADLAIGAGGVATWERLCLGLPSLVITIADNQKQIAEELDRRQLIKLIGSANTVSSDDIHDAFAEIVQTGIDEGWSARCVGLVDGLGCDRVAAVMLPQMGARLLARSARYSDEKILLEWANDPATRQSAFNSDQIGAAEHRDWLLSRLADARNFKIFVVETNDRIPIGQVRFDRCEGDSWEIDYTVAPEWRGLGLGRAILSTAIAGFRGDSPSATCFGRVKISNTSSCRVFESMGFQSDRQIDVIIYTDACV